MGVYRQQIAHAFDLVIGVAKNICGSDLIVIILHRAFQSHDAVIHRSANVLEAGMIGNGFLHVLQNLRVGRVWRAVGAMLARAQRGGQRQRAAQSKDM